MTFMGNFFYNKIDPMGIFGNHNLGIPNKGKIMFCRCQFFVRNLIIYLYPSASDEN